MLEATVIQPGRDVVDIGVAVSREIVGEVDLDWKILERFDGVTIQIIYGGPVEEEISLSGTIEGQGPPSLVNFNANDRPIWEQIFILVIPIVVLFMYFIPIMKFFDSLKGKFRYALVLLAAVLFMFVVLLIWFKRVAPLIFPKEPFIRTAFVVSPNQGNAVPWQLRSNCVGVLIRRLT